MIEIASMEQADDLLRNSYSHPVFIYKHSTRCGVSSYSAGQIALFERNHPADAFSVGRVLVVENRSVSLWIAEQLHVPHASPQVIFVREGHAVWDISHFGVSLKNLEEALTKIDGKAA